MSDATSTGKYSIFTVGVDSVIQLKPEGPAGESQFYTAEAETTESGGTETQFLTLRRVTVSTEGTKLAGMPAEKFKRIRKP